MKLLLRLIISTLAVMVAANLVPGVVVASTGTAIIVAIVLGILNTFLKPILQILALPITILTLGLFYFVVNVFIIYLRPLDVWLVDVLLLHAQLFRSHQ